METAINNLREWGKDTLKKMQEVKMLELEAVIRFILNNQPCDAFYLHGSVNLRGEQGMMWLSLENEMPVLFVNVDECRPFENQEELFESLFEGDFSREKLIKITGIKTL
jgi:hypothetical protein